MKDLWPVLGYASNGYRWTIFMFMNAIPSQIFLVLRWVLLRSCPTKRKVRPPNQNSLFDGKRSLMRFIKDVDQVPHDFRS